MAVLRTVALVVAFGLLGGCHTVFDGEVGAIRCRDEGAFGPPSCPVAQTCVAGSCVAVGVPLGHRCAADADCRPPSHCFDPADVDADGEPRCTRPCCSSLDCGPPERGLVCHQPGGGVGGLCWAADALGRRSLGERPGGADCSGDGDCRSGRCEGRCVDLCCHDPSCGGGEVCRVKIVEDKAGWSCGQPPTGADERICNGDQDCRTGLCSPTFETLNASLCVEPCCTSRECGDIEVDGTRWLLGCAVGDDGVRGCRSLLPASSRGQVGASCDADVDCRSGLCLDEGYCSDLCCDDASCGDASRYACRGGPVDGVWALRCIRK